MDKKKLWFISDIIKQSLVLNHLKAISVANFRCRYMHLVWQNHDNWKPKFNNQTNGREVVSFLFWRGIFRKRYLQTRVSPTQWYVLVIGHLKSLEA